MRFWFVHNQLTQLYKMKYSKVSYALIATLLIVSLQSNSQVSHKIGAGFTSDPLNVLTIDYSRVQETERAINFRASYGEESLFGQTESRIVIVDNPEENNYLSLIHI